MGLMFLIQLIESLNTSLISSRSKYRNFGFQNKNNRNQVVSGQDNLTG